MKQLATTVITALMLFMTLQAAAQTEQGDNSEWTGSNAQKIAGLSTIWAEAKFNFPYFDQVPDLDWDKAYEQTLPKALAARDLVEYYDVLTAFAALLQDGHTSVTPPWRFIKPGCDQPPMEVGIVDGAFVITAVGSSAEMKEKQIYPGLEILEVGEGVSAREFYNTCILPYSCQGTRQAHESVTMRTFLNGPASEPVWLKVKDGDGSIREVTLTRKAAQDNGQPFYGRQVGWYLFEPVMRHREIAPGIHYFQLSNFMKEDLPRQFEAFLDSVDVSKIKGLVLDVRFNPGGNSGNADDVVACLTDTVLLGSQWKSRCYIPAYRSWGREETWESREPYTIAPREGRRYAGPVAVLISPYTFSSAEDFLVPLKHSGRAVLVGSATAGSTGNPVYVDLPGGGKFRVVSKRDCFPDGTEFVGYGIKPDITVSATRQDYLDSRDAVLERALEWLQEAGSRQ